MWLHKVETPVRLDEKTVIRARVLQVKYAIIGAGQSGLQFLQKCVTKNAGSVAIVDTQAAIGGHWINQYSFVRLHAAVGFARLFAKQILKLQELLGSSKGRAPARERARAADGRHGRRRARLPQGSGGRSRRDRSRR